jgi:hypothetical protein
MNCCSVSPFNGLLVVATGPGVLQHARGPPSSQGFLASFFTRTSFAIRFKTTPRALDGQL